MSALNPGAPPRPTPRPKVRKPLKAKVHHIPDRVRADTFQTYGYLCLWCESPGGALDLHHVLRRSQGGRDEPGNLRPVHRTCHTAIHERPAEARHRGFLVGNGTND